MPLSNKRSPPRNVSPNHQTRRKAFPHRNPVANYHEIALRAAETGQKPQEDVIHSWLQDVRDRLEISSRINRASPAGEVDHEASWKPVFASPKTQMLLKSSHALPPPLILSRDVLLHSSPPELAKSANPAATSKLINSHRKRMSLTENYEHESGRATNKTFEKRPRHKTRHDRYDTKKRRHVTNRQTAPEKKKRRETVQEPRPRSGQDIMKNFASSYVGQGRIALKPKLGSGLFANGKGSDAQPMFNLKFAEPVFPIEHVHTPVQTDQNDRTKHKRRRSKELQDATGFFEQSTDQTKTCFDSRLGHPFTPLHEQSSFFVPSSALRQLTDEVVVRSIEDVHPNQRILTETPHSKVYSQKQFSNMAKSRSLVGASSRGSILRLSSKHISSASKVSPALTPCRAPRRNFVNTPTESRKIPADPGTKQARPATPECQSKTQADLDESRRRKFEFQTDSKLHGAYADELNTFGDSIRELGAQTDIPAVENNRFGAQAQKIAEQCSLNDFSPLQDTENNLNENRSKFLSSFKPQFPRQIWDADSIDAVINNNPRDFEPARITFEGQKDIEFGPKGQGFSQRGELDIPHARQSRLFANKSNLAVWERTNMPLEHDEHDARNQAETAAPAFEQTTSNDNLAESNPRVSSAAMRAFWKPNYLV